MSAITGIFYRDGRKVDPDQMKKMNDRLSHRGKDGSAIWCQGSVGLGHQMLWTTPESLQEKLPFHDEKAGLVITADARIDNRKELSQELFIEDKENVSDSYFILKSYEKWGEKCPEYLLGDFAFAIWDENEEKLFCARDHMGVKPFYYYLDDEMFVFGTEIKAILTLEDVPCELNKLKMAENLCLVFDDKKITFYDKIIRLVPANFLFMDNKNFNIKKYWVLDIKKEINLDSNEEYSDAFLEIFTEAVKCRLRSTFPIGSLLSGGLDSSSIVGTAQKILSKTSNNKLETYSATFEKTPECDEQFFINKIIEAYDVKPHFVEADKLSPLSQVNKVLWHLEEPYFTVNFYFHWHIHQQAQEQDVRIMLDGLDGDTTVSHGKRFEFDYFKSLKWIKGLKEVYMHSKRTKSNILKRHLFTYFLLPLIPEFIIRRLPITVPDMGSFNLINNDLARETNVKEKVKIYGNKYRMARSSKSFHYLILNAGILQYILEIVDKSAAAANIEERYPFFDKRLIEFCLALPLEQKLNNGWSRIIMRRAMKNILPYEIKWREDKAMLGPNFRKNLLIYEKNLIENLLFNKEYLIKDYVNIISLHNIFSRFISKKPTNTLSLFGVVTIVLWIQKIFHNRFE